VGLRGSALRAWLRRERARENAEAHEARVAEYVAGLEPEPEGGWVVWAMRAEWRAVEDRFEEKWRWVWG